MLLPSPALEVELGSSQGEVAISRQYPGTRSEIESSLSGDGQDSGSQSSEEAAFGRQTPGHSEDRESVQAFEITTKQVVLDCTKDYYVPSCFELG